MDQLLYTDFHVHLQDKRFTGNISAIVGACEREGIHRLFVNGTSPDDWADVVLLAELYPQVFPFYGVHPWFITDTGFIRNLEKIVAGGNCGIGEIGLDLWKEWLDEALQEDIFMLQFELAARIRLPVSIHCLKAFDWLMKLLNRFDKPLPVMILHAFSGSMQQLEALLEKGAYISFAANVMHSNKRKLCECLKAVPPERLLLESDAPDFLPPLEFVLQPLESAAGGSINTPRNIPSLYCFAAQVRECELPQLCGQLEENAARIMQVSRRES